MGNEENDLIEALKICENKISELSEELKLVEKLSTKHNGNMRIVSSALMSKNYADGMIKNLGNATLRQLDNLRANPTDYFRIGERYYDDEYLIKIIDHQILKTKRKNIIERLQ